MLDTAAEFDVRIGIQTLAGPCLLGGQFRELAFPETKQRRPHMQKLRYLTDPDDLVLDPFGGSNTTGAAAEDLGRRWVSVEANLNYIRGSVARFPKVHSYLKPIIPEQEAT